SGRTTRARHTANAAQPSVSAQSTNALAGCIHSGCHSMMPGRDRRTVVATNIHTLAPYGFASVAAAHSAGTASEIHRDGRPLATPTISSADHSTTIKAPTIQPP